MVTSLELQRRGLRHGVIVDAAATTASLADLERAGLRYKVEVASGVTAADRAALERRGLNYFVPVAVGVSAADRATLDRQGLRYAVQVDADILPADRASLEQQGLSYFVEVDSSGNSVAPGAGVVGGAALLTDETNGFATDFTYATDANRVAVKTAGTVVESGLDAFYQNAGTSPKQVYDVTGTLVWAPHNNVTRSQELDNAIWVPSGATVTANAAIAPDGTMTADRLVEVATTTNHQITHGTTTATLAGETYTFSVYAKAGERTWLSIQFPNATLQDWFDLTNGVVGTSANGGVITSVGNGWYRCSITKIPGTNTTAAIHARLSNGQTTTYLGDVASGLYIWGAQINRGTTPLVYLPTASAVRFGLAIDYDPVTHASKGLLCEPAATNLLLNNATLSTQSVTVTAVAHTLSFFGTGTITLSGVSTAGPLVGTGATNRVSLTFTPTAGSLTCTVTGTVSRAQLETGSAATSPIPTFAVTATRAADSYNCTPAAINYSATAGSWWAEFTTRSALVNQRIVGFTTIVTPLAFTTSTLVALHESVTLTKTVTSLIDGLPYKAASAYQSGSRAVTAQGLTPGTDAGVTTVLLNPGASLFFGNGGTALVCMLGHIRKIYYLPRLMSNAELMSKTT